MRILAIETATEACSVALFDEGRLVDAKHEVLGRGHAERLVPMIASLPEKGRAEEIRVSLGPGSFTGVRIGLAVARALGIAWHATVLGYPTLALLAAMARTITTEAVTVAMNGGHGEWFVQNFDAQGLPSAKVSSLTPEAAAAQPVPGSIVGNRAEDLAKLRGRTALDVRLPDARHILALPDALLTGDLAPLYGRTPDAKLPAK